MSEPEPIQEVIARVLAIDSYGYSYPDAVRCANALTAALAEVERLTAENKRLWATNDRLTHGIEAMIADEDAALYGAEGQE